ncbi:MAG: rod shape-determining protein MreD [Breznakia sp.]
MMIIQYAFVFLAFVVDGIISAIFPIPYAMDTLYFIPCLGIIALVLTIRKLEKIDAIILSVFAGMYYDFFFTNRFLLYTIAFLILCFMVKQWGKHMGASIIESVAISIACIFMLQLLVFGIEKITMNTYVSLSTWVVNRMFLTLIVNTVLAMVIFFFDRYRDEYLRVKAAKIRRSEHIFLFRSKENKE